MFLVSPMTSQNEDLMISCEWVLNVEITTQFVMILYPASKEWLITRGFSWIPIWWSSLYGEKFARTWKRAAAGVSVCLLLPVRCGCQFRYASVSCCRHLLHEKTILVRMTMTWSSAFSPYRSFGGCHFSKICLLRLLLDHRKQSYPSKSKTS